MRKALRMRYYCEFCGKGSGSPSYMKRHEAGCTNNPNRVCGMCGGCQTPPVPKLVDELLKDTIDLTFLRKATGNCPACILAAIRQSKLQRGQDGMHIDFDFTTEKKLFWDRIDDRGDD